MYHRTCNIIEQTWICNRHLPGGISFMHDLQIIHSTDWPAEFVWKFSTGQLIIWGFSRSVAGDLAIFHRHTAIITVSPCEGFVIILVHLFWLKCIISLFRIRELLQMFVLLGFLLTICFSWGGGSLGYWLRYTCYLLGACCRWSIVYKLGNYLSVTELGGGGILPVLALSLMQYVQTERSKSACIWLD